MTDTIDPDGNWTVYADLSLLALVGSVPPPPPAGVLLMQGLAEAGYSAYTDTAVARVAGTVKKQTDADTQTPVARLVRLHCQHTGRMVAQTWSDAAGAYAFDRVGPGRYMVLSLDHTGAFAGVVEPDVLVQMKPQPHAHRTERLDAHLKLQPVPVYVRDRLPVYNEGGGGGGGGF